MCCEELGDRLRKCFGCAKKEREHTRNIKKISARHLCVYLRPPTNAQCGKFPFSARFSGVCVWCAVCVPV